MNTYSVLYFLWFLRFFKPEWILAFYIPGIGIIKAISNLFLYGFLAYLIFQRTKITIDKPILFYFLAMVISAIFAFNTGQARIALFSTLDTLIFFAVNIAIIKDDRHIDQLLRLYLAAFVFYAIFGIANGGLVPFHIVLNNEDAFGPFMDLGVPLAFFLSLKDKKVKYYYVIVGLLCVLGLIASIARGAFLALCGVAFFIWLKSSRKMTMAVAGIFMALFFAVAASLLFEGGKYWEEMSSIDDSIQSEAHDGRHWLNEKGLQMFFTYPLIGVGPRNYGPALSRIVPTEDAERRAGWTPIQLYYRVPHNIYVQLLSEMGIIGIISFLGMIYVFWKRNNRIQRECRSQYLKNKDQEELSSQFKKYYYYSLALNGSMVAYLLNGPFYDILYYHWLFDLLIFNYLIYRNFRALSVPKKYEAVGEMVHA